jgi:hypothetical protein
MSDANEEGLVKSILRKLAGTLGFVLLGQMKASVTKVVQLEI